MYLWHFGLRKQIPAQAFYSPCVLYRKQTGLKSARISFLVRDLISEEMFNTYWISTTVNATESLADNLQKAKMQIGIFACKLMESIRFSII